LAHEIQAKLLKLRAVDLTSHPPRSKRSVLGAHLEPLGSQQAFRVSHGLRAAYTNLVWSGAIACGTRALHNLIVNPGAMISKIVTFAHWRVRVSKRECYRGDHYTLPV
jgi:hypothetical protein